MFNHSITTKEHRAATLFTNDVNDTYNRIKTRAAELSKENSASNDPAGVEQIQLHAVDPNTKITINIPGADSEDPTEIEARKIFESFSPEGGRGLVSYSKAVRATRAVLLGRDARTNSKTVFEKQCAM